MHPRHSFEPTDISTEHSLDLLLCELALDDEPLRAVHGALGTEFGVQVRNEMIHRPVHAVEMMSVNASAMSRVAKHHEWRIITKGINAPRHSTHTRIPPADIIDIGENRLLAVTAHLRRYHFVALLIDGKVGIGLVNDTKDACQELCTRIFVNTTTRCNGRCTMTLTLTQPTSWYV